MAISVPVRTCIAYACSRKSALKHLFTAIAALEFTAFITVPSTLCSLSQKYVVEVLNYIMFFKCSKLLLMWQPLFSCCVGAGEVEFWGVASWWVIMVSTRRYLVVFLAFLAAHFLPVFVKGSGWWLFVYWCLLVLCWLVFSYVFLSKACGGDGE